MNGTLNKLHLPQDQADYVFFTVVIEHNDVWYKMAVAEEVYEDEDGPDVTGNYTVLLQSEKGTFFFNIHRDEEGNWEPDIVRVPYELIYKIGTQIANYY